MNMKLAIAALAGFSSTGCAPERAGGITHVAFVDHDQFSLLGISATSCTIVHGS